MVKPVLSYVPKLESRYRAALSATVGAKAHYLALAGDLTSIL
jgi:hypothetical protein